MRSHVIFYVITQLCWHWEGVICQTNIIRFKLNATLLDYVTSSRYCNWNLPKVCTEPNPKASQDICCSCLQVCTVIHPSWSCVINRTSSMTLNVLKPSLFWPQGGLHLSLCHDAGSGLHRKAPTQKPWIPSKDLLLRPFPDLHGESSAFCFCERALQAPSCS